MLPDVRYQTECTTVSVEIPSGGSGGSPVPAPLPGGGFGGGPGGGSPITDPCDGKLAGRYLIPNPGEPLFPCYKDIPWEPVSPPNISSDPIDSLIAVRLKRLYEKTQKTADSLFSKAQENKNERTFTFVKSTTDTVIKWAKEGTTYSSSPTLAENYFGIWHSHQDEYPRTDNRNQSFDGPDIYKQYYHAFKNQNVEVSVITTRDFIYASVITDKKKFTNYIRSICGTADASMIYTILDDRHTESMKKCGTCTWQKMSEMGTMNITANNNSEISGIKVFVSSKQNIEFTLLKP
jgi:hypothetical protein